MNLHATTKALAGLLFAYLFLFVISYSTFLQTPVFKNQPLVWQSVIEQSISWIPLVIGYLYLFKTIQQKKKQHLIQERVLFIPTLILLYLAGMSVGIHFASQIIEDTLVNQQELFAYKLALFLDEQLGHLFIFPLSLLSFAISLLELNRELPKLTRWDNAVTTGLGILTSLLIGILSVEAGFIYLINLPILVGILIMYYKVSKKHSLNPLNYPFSRYVILSLSFSLIFILIWISVFGVLQPEAAGLHLLEF